MTDTTQHPEWLKPRDPEPVRPRKYRIEIEWSDEVTRYDTIVSAGGSALAVARATFKQAHQVDDDGVTPTRVEWSVIA